MRIADLHPCTIQQHRIYYSVQVCVQTQVHFLIPLSHNPIGWLTNTIGERSGAAPTAFKFYTKLTYLHFYLFQLFPSPSQ